MCFYFNRFTLCFCSLYVTFLYNFSFKSILVLKTWNSSSRLKWLKPFLIHFKCSLIFQSFQNFVSTVCKTCLHKKSRSSPSQVFLRKGVLKIDSKFTGEHPCQSAIPIKLLCNVIEITLRHECSPINLLHMFRIPFSEEYPWMAASGNLSKNFRQSTDTL